MQETYRGSCHRGAIRFEAKLDHTQSSCHCNCSICRTCVDGRNDRQIAPEFFSHG